MAPLDIGHLKEWEELPHDGQHLVRDVLALGAPDEQGRLLEPVLAGVLEGEVAHVGQGLAEDVDGDAELPGLLALRGVQVPQEELADGEGLCGSGY